MMLLKLGDPCTVSLSLYDSFPDYKGLVFVEGVEHPDGSMAPRTVGTWWGGDLGKWMGCIIMSFVLLVEAIVVVVVVVVVVASSESLTHSNHSFPPLLPCF